MSTYARIDLSGSPLLPVVVGLVDAPGLVSRGEVTVRVSRSVRARIVAGETSCAALGIAAVVRQGRVVSATPRSPGRPPQGDNARRETIRYRVTPTELARATEIARTRGQSVHDFARSVLEKELASTQA